MPTQFRALPLRLDCNSKQRIMSSESSMPKNEFVFIHLRMRVVVFMSPPLTNMSTDHVTRPIITTLRKISLSGERAKGLFTCVAWGNTL